MSNRNTKAESEAWNRIARTIYLVLGSFLFTIGLLGLNADLLIPASILISGCLISNSIERRNTN